MSNIDKGTKRSQFLKVTKQILTAREAGIFFVMVFLICILSVIAPRFLTVTNLLNVGRQTALTGIMAVGMGLVLIAGNIDLSIGSNYGLSALMAAMILVRTRSSIVALIAGLMIGLAVGLINGFLTVKVKMPSFVATFGTMFICRGVALILTRGYPITLLTEGINQETHPLFFFLGQGSLFGKIPMQFVFMVVVMIILGIMLHKTIGGLHIFAVGGSEKASFASGIKVEMVRLKTFVISGLCASLAGILNVSFIGSILPTAGQGLEFQVFASAIIGGTSMSGGEGSVIGIFIGALILGIISNGLVLLGVDPFWQVLIIGIITISAVTYDTLTWQKRQERRMAAS
ncbi:MAG: ABC transporter permease [Spirochaetaceae bacterium]|nr:MAG: ABC transporter permease [Spirochaetaceae bacterium]